MEVNGNLIRLKLKTKILQKRDIKKKKTRKTRSKRDLMRKRDLNQKRGEAVSNLVILSHQMRTSKLLR